MCPQINAPKGIICNQAGACLKVKGPLDLSSTGIISSIAATIERENMSLFSISTYHIDDVMVKEKNLERAILAFTEAGQQIQWEQNE